jgi:hypothetical protein
MFEEPRDALYLLQRWYLTQCDDEWEHAHGIAIDTIDNPGWSLRVDLTDTSLAGLTLDWSRAERSEHDWVHWRVHEAIFEAACGPTNLNEAILAFLDLTGARTT